MKEIQSFKKKLSRLRNAEHVEFQLTILAYATEEVKAIDSLAGLWKKYITAYRAEDRLFKKPHRMQGTDEIVLLNKKRNSLFYALKYAVEAAVHNVDDDAARTAGRALLEVVNNFKKAPRLPYIENSAYISRMVMDMELPENKAHLATLSLGNVLANLNEANEAFRLAYDNRGEWLYTVNRNGNMQAVRQRVDDAFDALSRGITLLYQTAVLTSADASLQARLSDLIDTFNIAIASARRVYSLRTKTAISD